MEILQKIDELRKERGWSINYLAMEAGLTQSTVNNLFLRKTEPKISTLRALCDAFGITLSEFFADNTPMDILLLQRIRRLSTENKEALLKLLSSIK